jgi:hypothetical protein
VTLFLGMRLGSYEILPTAEVVAQVPLLTVGMVRFASSERTRRLDATTLASHPWKRHRLSKMFR